MLKSTSPEFCVKKNTEMLTKPTDSSNFLFQICMQWKRAGHLCSFLWKCSTVLWRNKDICRTTPCSDLGCCLSLNCSVKPLFSIPWQPRYQNVFIEEEKSWQRICRGFQDIWTLSYFFTGVNGIPVCLVCSQQVSVVKKYRIFGKGCSLNVIIIIFR